MLKIEKIKQKIPVYDLTVENSHNFFANELLVHNCAEIIQYSDPKANKIAVCNLASISLPSCVVGKKGKRTFDFNKLAEITETLVENLNKIIDTEFYPLEAARNSNLSERPIGVGVQGMADMLALLRLSWESPEALDLNEKIAETMYYSALNKSCELAKIDGPYPSYEGSPISQGILQCDSWGTVPSNLWNWDLLRSKIKEFGIKNSVFTAIMPTASSSQILGNTEMVEPITSNIYKRSTLSGEFIQINKYLVEDLMELGLWNENIRQQIIAANGSIQNIYIIPQELKNLYKTVWELSQKIIINMARARAPYICQSQSMNLYIRDVNAAKVSSAIFAGWRAGLKTICYYLRSEASRDATKVTVDKDIEKQVLESKASEVASIDEEGIACSIDNPEDCVMCSA